MARSNPLARPLATCAAVLLLAGCGGGASDGGEASASPTFQADSDSAVRLAERLLEWQGGADAWNRTAFLRFRWIVERGGEVLADRSHAWDRRNDRYRLTYLRDDSTRVYMLFGIRSMKSDTVPPEGHVWVGEERLEGAARDSALERGYGMFINDSYWLTMPLKWADPGVHLAYEGATELPDGNRYPTVHLTFEPDLGVTNDQYWAFLDPETGRMVAWRYHLQGRDEKGSVIWWEDWQRTGPIRLAMNRRFEGGDTRIYFEDVEAAESVPDTVFGPPAK